jgi:hypothetical protein
MNLKRFLFLKSTRVKDMFSFKSFRQGWNNFFYEEVDSSSLCLFRIILGFFLLVNGVSLIPDFDIWYGLGSNSLLPLNDSLNLSSTLRLNLFKWMSPTENSAWFILIAYTVSSFSFMVGFKTRASGIFCFILLVSLQTRNYAILNSGDTLMRCLLFPLMFSPVGRKYSVDAYLVKKMGITKSDLIPVTFLRLLQLQFSLVYLATTLFKLKGYDWVDGTAIYYTARLENFRRLAIPGIFDYAILCKILTWSALFIEFSMGSLVWVKEWRRWVLLSGIILHLGIELTMSIGLFEWIMMGAYVLFLQKNEIDSLKRWSKART